MLANFIGGMPGGQMQTPPPHQQNSGQLQLGQLLLNQQMSGMSNGYG